MGRKTFTESGGKIAIILAKNMAVYIDFMVKFDHNEMADIKGCVKGVASQHGCFKEKHAKWFNFIIYGVDQRKSAKCKQFNHRKMMDTTIDQVKLQPKKLEKLEITDKR